MSLEYHKPQVLAGEAVRGLCRQAHGEGRAGGQRALHLDRTAVLTHDMFGDGQPQSRAAHVARARLIHDVETFEDAAEMLGRDADARILNVDNAGCLGLFGPDRYPAFFGIFDGIVDQVGKELLQAELVGGEADGPLAFGPVNL